MGCGGLGGRIREKTERKKVSGWGDREKLECGSIRERYIYHFIIASPFLNLEVYREKLGI